MGTDKYNNFRTPLEAYIETSTDSTCGKVKEIFVMNVKKYLPSNEDD